MFTFLFFWVILPVKQMLLICSTNCCVNLYYTLATFMYCMYVCMCDKDKALLVSTIVVQNGVNLQILKVAKPQSLYHV